MQQSAKSKFSILFLQIFILYLLTSCSPNRVPTPHTVSSSPKIAKCIFTSFDNTELPLRVWLPANEINGVLIALHGFNDYSNFIKDSSSFFTKRKLAVYSYDQRGFGETATRGRWSGWQAMADDLSTLVSLIKQVHADTPVYILGDSMGGAVAIVNMTQKSPPDVHGVILVAPAVWARSEMPLYQRFALWIAAHTVPWKIVTGQSLRITPSDNIEMLRELGKDPLVIKETRIEVLYGLSNLMNKAFHSAERLRVRSLLLYGKKDEIIPQQPIFDFYERLPLKSQGQQQMILYENGYHMLLRDLQSEKVQEEIVDWIEDKSCP